MEDDTYQRKVQATSLAVVNEGVSDYVWVATPLSLTYISHWHPHFLVRVR
jgi:hypothetical protein